MHENPQYLHKNNALEFISDDKGESYNTCHCASGVALSHRPCADRARIAPAHA